MAETQRTLAARSVRSLLPRLALAAAALTITSGCVTRTVYVADTRDRYVAAEPEAAPLDTAPPRGADVTGPETFYEPLAPYGTWHAHPRYGRVWAPAAGIVGPGWRPYTRGHWEYTEWGWTWVSELPFGWATSHYGNWYYDASYGWVWVPGTRWAPAWVTWRTGGGYVGWAPLPPGAVYGASYSVYDTGWIFVSTRNFGAPLIYPVIVTGAYYRNCLVVTRPYRTTYVVYGNTYYRGPDPDRVRREGGRVVHRPIREVDRDRPVTRPPRGVRVSTVGHSGHDGSVGARRPDRDSRGRGDRGDGRGRGDDRATPRDRHERPDQGRGDGRGRGDDRVRDRRGDGDSGRGSGDQSGRGRSGSDGRVDDPRGSDGRPAVGGDRDGARGPGRTRPPARGVDGLPGRGGVTPPRGGRTPPGLDSGADRGNDGARGDSGRGDDTGGVRANKDVVRPDAGERRPPSDNPYNSNPGSSGGGLGAQTAPTSSGARGDSRVTPPTGIGSRLPSGIGTPRPQAPGTRAPVVNPPRGAQFPATAPSTGTRPTPTPSPGFGAPSQRTTPGFGAPSQRTTPGLRAPAVPPAGSRVGTPSAQPSGVVPQRAAPTQRYTPRAPARQAPAAKSDDKRKENARSQSRAQPRKESNRRAQPRSRR